MKNLRRDFLKKSVLAAGSLLTIPTIIPGSALGKNGFVTPSDRINLGFIGAGNQAGNDVKDFLADKRVQVTAVCDVNKKSSGYWNGKVAGRDFIMQVVDEHYSEKNNSNYQSAIGYTDFRELLENKDIDAVEVVTPDHWHSIPVMMAAAAGKHIYCQKPLSLTVDEGRAMSDAVKKYGVTFQTGSQQRSSHHFRRVCELARNGRLGELHTVTCGLPGGTPDFGKTGHLTETIPVPKDFDYDMWLGPAPEAPYSPCRTHVNFRWNLDYSGGNVTDWGGHHPDIAQWGMGTELTGPVRIQNAQAVWSDHPVWNTATRFYFECIYDNGVKLIIQSDKDFGVTFQGTEGSAWATRGDHKINPESLKGTVIGPNETQLYVSDNHFTNFIDCIYSGEETVAPAEVGHRSITLAHLGNIAMMLEQDLVWDPKKEQFKDNFAANQLLIRKMREPWGALYRSLKV
ncbi:Gfo/Idh/MocA family protein [Cyclobacterium qasimii]|uniref:Myo-inositol 2-dehydrogenase n=2 Tax=Cyclobacterium qasimii TaxID=1350429 RepID=S7WIT2_9BACT|nr:Gfo/Idh/MocA family oxidoreductase [Cyclobacterium qasimii]EPR66639.1 Myo-inositol 2-dehydrogenase [Cyclobacterium qasimii M12-11B]GEO22819.1 oxidoreductase [Cyclobacterium qasimii]